jgi:hypothetical protein
MCACVWVTVVLMTIIAIVEEAFFESQGVKRSIGEEEEDVAQDTAKPTSNAGDESAQLRKYSLGSVSSNHSHSNNSAAGNVKALADSMFISTNVDESPAHRPRSATLDPKSPSLSSNYNSFSFPVAVNPNRSGSKDFGGVESSGTPSLPGANVNAIDPTRASSYSVLNPPASSSSSSGSTSGRRHLPPSVKTLLRGNASVIDNTVALHKYLSVWNRCRPC